MPAGALPHGRADSQRGNGAWALAHQKSAPEWGEHVQGLLFSSRSESHGILVPTARGPCTLCIGQGTDRRAAGTWCPTSAGEGSRGEATGQAVALSGARHLPAAAQGGECAEGDGGEIHPCPRQNFIYLRRASETACRMAEVVPRGEDAGDEDKREQGASSREHHAGAGCGVSPAGRAACWKGRDQSEVHHARQGAPQPAV